MKEEESNYCYPGTNVLRNKPGFGDQKKLESWERMVTAKRQAQLEVRPIVESFDLEHLKAVHRYLFQDVYEWAGEIRTEDIGKGFTGFAHWRFIESQADDLYSQLRKENYLADAEFETFCERAAYYLSETNVIHPFREGNGRTQREFIRCLAMNAGFDLIWDRVDDKVLLQAMITAAVRTEADLAMMIRDCFVNREKDPELIRFYQNGMS